MIFDVSELEKVQVTLLKLLMTNSDGNEKRPSSRSVFLRKFREHIREAIRVRMFIDLNIALQLLCYDFEL